MIADKLENAGLYSAIDHRLAKGLELLKDNSLSRRADGRYDLDGDAIYYIVQRYATKPPEEGRLEAHRRYIDIQFIAEGEELLGHAPLAGLKESVRYDAQKDIAFYEVPRNVSLMKLSAGMFAVFFPQDAHMPCLRVGGPENVVKIVVKVKAGEQLLHSQNR
jgi:YhcH/YjgK/YiaL family protein